MLLFYGKCGHKSQSTDLMSFVVLSCAKMIFILLLEISLSEEGCSHVFRCLRFVLNHAFLYYSGSEI